MHYNEDTKRMYITALKVITDKAIRQVHNTGSVYLTLMLRLKSKTSNITFINIVFVDFETSTT